MSAGKTLSKNLLHSSSLKFLDDLRMSKMKKFILECSLGMATQRTKSIAGYDTATFVPENEHNKPINLSSMGNQFWGANP